MRLSWVSLGEFRSHGSLEWSPEPGVNLLVGPNGAGKTSLLEAIGYLATLDSFRSAPDEALPAFGEQAGFVRGEVRDRDSTSLIEVEIRRRGGRRAYVNRQRLGRAADLLGHVRAVAFLPEDLDLVKRGPSYRRDFLDAVAVQLWPGSYLDQAELDRALRQRNAFLRQGVQDDATLDVWDERMAVAGGKVLSRRARAAAAIAGPVQESYTAISGAEVKVGIDYVSTWVDGLDPSIPPAEHAALLRAALTHARRHDRDRRVTTVGPQRDEPIILLDGNDLRLYGSQGEQRTAALSMRLAVHRAVMEVAGVSPILLLDDVYSELDPARSTALTRCLPPAQIFVTTTHPEDVPLAGPTWRVSPGKVAL